MKRTVARLLSALILAGCGGTSGAFQRSDAAAERAYSAGRYAEAAERWQTAADHAGRTTDRDEALYRAAKSYERAGRRDEAGTLLSRLVHDSPRGARSARAAYDVALILLDAGHTERARAELDAVIRTYPESGLAAEALARRVDALRVEGERAVRAYLDGLLPALERSEVGQYLHYSYAQSLERSGELAPARERYALVAARWPYPAALWDDALFHAAELDVRLDEPRRAIERLVHLLDQREKAYFQGSYERRRYAEAQFRIAELYRDVLLEPGRARAAFEQLWSAHPSSRLRDDAAWSAARLAADAGDQAGACATLRALVAELPASRYVPCIKMLCPTLEAPPGSGECRDYIAREARRTPEADDR